MTTALSARRKLAGRAAIPAAAVAATLMLASSAAAAAPASDSVPAGGRSLQTLFGNVKVFASASTEAVASGQLGPRGTAVSVTCWTTGLDYNGNPIWYRISAPVKGYVAEFNIAAHFAPALGVPHCHSPAFSAVFNSLEVNLRIRAAPSTTAKISGYLVSIGSNATLDCYVTGTVILGDAIWYHAVSPAVGYVTGRFLNTGGDPAPGVPRC
jgi:transcriptional regulator of nitric oxide reductase